MPWLPSPKVAGRRSAKDLPSRSRLGSLDASILREALIAVGAVLIAAGLEWAVWGGHLTGSRSPSWDFMAAYNTDAYSWWRSGSFFDPPEWLPTMWGGYPSGTSLQSGSFYLPIGTANALSTHGYTVRIAAALAALHVALGALGMYTLLRRLGSGYSAAVLGLIAAFFLPGFYANAEHLDIARGYAWLPWLLLICSPRWPWRRWWAVPVAAFVAMQVAMGVYPGLLVAVGYCLPLWLAGWVFVERGRWRWLVWLTAAGAAGVLMSLVKYWPALLVSVPTHLEELQDMTFLPETIFFRYDIEGMANDISMRPWFVSVPVLVLVGTVHLRDRRVLPPMATLLAALGLGLPVLPWFQAASSLPGLSLSRFRMSDFKAVILTLLVVLAGIALDQALRQSAGSVQRAIIWVALVAAAAGLVGHLRQFSTADLTAPLVILALSAGCVLVLATPWGRGWRTSANVAVATLVAATLASGWLWAQAVPQTWSWNRVQAEKAKYGTTVAAMQRSAQPTDRFRRPERVVPSPPTATVMLRSRWNGLVYANRSSIGGYANLKSNPVGQRLLADFTDRRTGALARRFYAARGAVVPEELLAGGRLSEACLARKHCHGLDFIPVRYSPGDLRYNLYGKASPGKVALNEPFYPGWRAEVCQAGQCAPALVSAGRFDSVTVDVPKGESTIHVWYEAPGQAEGWVAFWAGLAGAVAAAAAVVTLQARAGRRARREANGLATTTAADASAE